MTLLDLIIGVEHRGVVREINTPSRVLPRGQTAMATTNTDSARIGVGTGASIFKSYR